mgnify:CR=1 FL=1
MDNGNTKMLNDMKELQKKIFDRLSSKQSLARNLIIVNIHIINICSMLSLSDQINLTRCQPAPALAFMSACLLI